MVVVETWSNASKGNVVTPVTANGEVDIEVIGMSYGNKMAG